MSSSEVMHKLYSYTISGTDGNSLAWIVHGQVNCNFQEVFEEVIIDSFNSLRARISKPDESLCHSGPYEVTRILIERSYN